MNNCFINNDFSLAFILRFGHDHCIVSQQLLSAMTIKFFKLVFHKLLTNVVVICIFNNQSNTHTHTQIYFIYLLSYTQQSVRIHPTTTFHLRVNHRRRHRPFICIPFVNVI